MKQKLFSIFCFLLLSASMVTQAQLLDAVNDSPEGETIPQEANLVSGRRNTPPNVTWNLAWDYADQGNSVMNTNGYAYLGTKNGYKLYRYQWDSDLQIYFAFSDNSATWTSPISGATCVMPPRGTYTVSTTCADFRIGAYNCAWDGNTTQSRYVESGTSYHFSSGTWYVEEGVDGPCMYSTDCYLRNAGTNKLIIGDPAVYRNVTVRSNADEMGTTTALMKSGYVYTTNITDWKDGSVYTLTATPSSAKYSFVAWQKNGVQISTSATTDVTIDSDATYTAVFSCTSCSSGTITGVASPAAGGSVTVSPSGSQSGGTIVTLTATPNSGYQFTQWNDGNTENPRSVCVDGSETYTATFIQKLHDFEYHFTWADDVCEGACGSVASGGTKTSNKWYCLRAQILKNYVHTGAMGYPAINIDIITSQSANTTNGYKNYGTGRYLPNPGTYTNSTNTVSNTYRGYIVKSGTSGSTSCFTKYYDESGNAYTFQSGSIQFITATSGETTWPFIYVNGTFGGKTVFVTVGTAPTYTITLNNQSANTAGTTSVTAHYTESTNLTSAITKPVKNGYVFGGYYTATNGGGTQIIDENGNFVARAGGNDNYMDAVKRWFYQNNLTLYAKWIQTHTLTLDVTGNGTVTVYNDTKGEEVTFTNNEAQIENEDNIVITYLPAAGFHVGTHTYSGEGNFNSGDDFFMDGDHTITVTFEPDVNTTTYTLTLNAGAHGTVTVYNNTKNYNVTFTNNEAQIAEDDEIVITYTPAAGYHVGTHTDSEEGTFNSGDGIFMEGDHTITVTFEPDVYNITYKDKGNVAFTGTHGSGYPTTHTYGTATALVNPTKANATFGGWYENSSCTGSAVTSIAATAKTADFTLYAKWRGTITATASGSGSVSGAGTYDVGANVSLTATPSNSNYYLYDWEKDGVSLGVRTNTLVQSVTANAAYTAVFREKEWTLTVNSDNPSLGSASGSGKYYNGENTTLVATPANSFTSFVKWQKNGVDIAGGASLNVTVNANDTYTAFFSGRNIIEVDIDASYTDRGSIYSLRGYSSDNKYYVDAAFYNSNDALYSVDGITYNSSSLSFTTKTSEGYEQPCGNRVITHLLCYNATGDVYRFNIHWSFPWGDDENDTFPNDRTINANQQAGYDSDLNAIYVYGYTKEYEWNGQATLRAMGMYFVTSLRCSDAIKLPEGTYDINCSGEPGTVMSYQSGMDKDLSGGWAQTQGVEHGYYLLDKGIVTVTKSGSTYTITVNAKNSYGNDLKGTLTMDESVITGTIPSYTLNVTTDGHGTASVKRYDCNGDLNAVSNSGSYKQGSYFRLEATANAGYAFDYWTMTGSSEHFDENPIELEGLYANATITAHFKSAYALAWDANGGELDGTAGEDYTPAGYYAAGTSITAPTATRIGYTFTGWSPDFTGTMPSANTTYTAQWTPDTYTITYRDQNDEAYSGSNLASLPATHTYNAATDLVDGVKDGYTFNGWYENAECTGEAVTTIAANSITAGKTLYAKWTATVTTHTITLSNGANGTITVHNEDTDADVVFTDNTATVQKGTTLTITATGNTYEYVEYGLFTLKVNGNAFASGNTLSLTEDITIAATYGVILWDNRDNNYYNDFKKHHGNTENAIYNRQFVQGRWATLCLPFYVDNGTLRTMSMLGRVYEFSKATGSATIIEGQNNGITLYFSNATSLEAGKCYIVNANASLAKKTSFMFSNVTINLTNDNVSDLNGADAYDDLYGYNKDGTIKLVGTLRKGTLIGTGTGNTYMGLKDNMIYYPNHEEGNIILAYRGLFRSSESLNAERIRIIVDGEEKAELEVINGELQDVQETKKFIENGVLYIERNGVIYDATGRKVE